ncbi:type VII secretion protein EccCb [Streptomyces zagrosensis]|uniref:S-DNA-T family DNA segregation ATPase FtsK/SpoIIIE n=1 Tax=Streptomyces zagrosensis TaxID=1042984 RepID=A0A7W9Q5B2_9ACTN|nr:type VII secretion protein EccCb [Streptomyces zagrosensis]MBB5933920.1 S-DNA-T family DNA segregation ATPase FtsK/SpoIIIE [Streptomyces zagrosensis]
MSVRVVHRPARTTRPLPAPAERHLEPPPNLPESKASSAATSLLPMAGVLSSVVMMTVVRNSQFAAIGAVVLVVAVIGGVALLFSQRGRAQRTRRTQRERYLEYLEELREELSAENRELRAAARVLAPPPEALYDLVNDPARLWERRRLERDFLDVRVGTGEAPVRTLVMERQASTVLSPPDPFMLNEAAGLQERFATVPEAPLTVSLDRAGNVSVVGERAHVLGIARTIAMQAAVLHAPDDVAFALSCPESRLADWAWAKWLPHILDPQAWDGPVNARRIAPSARELDAALGAELRQRAAYAAEVRRGLAGREALRLGKRLLLIHDSHGDTAHEPHRPDEAITLPDMGVTALHLLARRVDEPGQVSIRISAGDDGRTVTVEDLRGDEPVTFHGTLDEVTAAGALGLARLMAPLRLSAESAAAGTPLSGPVDFPALIGVDDPGALDIPRLWAPRRDQNYLRVPIGLSDAREPVLLDLKESAELGMGPHGLCVGATGSGKSELLRTLVLALVTTHPPQDLAMVLVDYKGGATFAPFAPLPHVAGVITNLENRAGLVERVHSSLSGEVKRRQQVLKDAGNIADISTYAATRAQRPELGLESLPHLFVVIDEFGELLTAKPDFIDLFLSIGRIGRSIGVHLLLSSQRIEGGKLKGLDTYLSYRLGLRTFSPDESRTVLDTTDAFHLPPIPGFGYLKVDTSAYERFKAGYVSGPYRGPARHDVEEERGPAALPYPTYNTLATGEDGGGTGEGEPGSPAAPARRTVGPTLMSTMVDQLIGAAPPVQQIWLPPLPEALTLDAAAGPVRAGTRGMELAGRPGGGALRVPLGLLDDPARQWQGQWVLDLTVAGGHVAVIGGPASGKTTLLRTLVLALALTHTPQEVGVYCLDLVGGGLQTMAGLPHVGGVAGRSDRERASRTVEEVRSMLAAREEAFREHGIDSVEELRRLRARGGLPELGSTDIVLVVDGFGELRDTFEALDDPVTELLKRGSGYGIHVVAGMLRWNEVRIVAQSAFGTRIELRLNDPSDSTVNRRLAETLSPDEPGRALTDAKLFAQVALPRIDGLGVADELGGATEHAVRAVSSAWSGPAAPPVRVLPARLGLHRLPGPEAEPRRVPVGLDQNALRPVLLDLFRQDQHLLVLGDGECGKTNMLRLIARGLMERYADDQLVFAVLDPRRGLHSLVPDDYRGGYAHNAKLATGLSGAIATELAKRLPDEAMAPEQLAAGGIDFSGPRIVVLVDDYDVLAVAGQQPLEPFLPYLPSARDIGLHFVVTRRVAGASRAMYEPFLMTMRESGTAALVMTGDRSEGQLFPGVYAQNQPAGRGTFVRRGAPPRLVQTAVAPDSVVREREDEHR